MILEILIWTALLFACLFAAAFAAVIVGKLCCWNDKIFESLVYWLIVGLLAASRVFQL